MNRSDYKRLGDYIREVDFRNRDLAVTNLLGVSISKEFIPSIANTIGTDMSSYKVVRPNQFAYGPVTSRNGDKVSIALFHGDGCAIISQAYTVFEVQDEATLMPEYLMMWFRRPEFDRYARFHSHGSAREVFDWDEMCDVLLPVPSIERQRAIVAEYETLSRCIGLNRSMIAQLEATAQTLYRKMFVDDIDPEHLPAGWHVGALNEIAEISSGKTCVNKSNNKEGQYIYPVAGASGIIGYSTTYNQEGELLTTGRVGTLGVVNRYKTKLYTADNVLIIKSNNLEFCYQVLSNLDYEEITKGGVQSLITQTDLNKVMLVIPSQCALSSYEKISRTIYRHIDLIDIENKNLTELQSLLLAKMGQ